MVSCFVQTKKKCTLIHYCPILFKCISSKSDHLKLVWFWIFLCHCIRLFSGSRRVFTHIYIYIYYLHYIKAVSCEVPKRYCTFQKHIRVCSGAGIAMRYTVSSYITSILAIFTVKLRYTDLQKMCCFKEKVWLLIFPNF